MRMPGGEWTDTLTLEDVEPGTYIIEVMDEDGNITTMEITVTDEQIAKGHWRPTEAGGGRLVRLGGARSRVASASAPVLLAQREGRDVS